MRRFVPRLVPLVVALAVATGCGDSGSTTTPAAAATVETFTGTLTVNSAFTYPFVVLAAGSITAVLTTLSPDSTSAIGLALGTWNGTTSTCQIVLANDVSIQGSTVLATATTSGNFCLRVYDAGGTIASPETYNVQVTHP